MRFLTFAFHAFWFLPVSFVLGENCKVVCIFDKMEFNMGSGIERKLDSESLTKKLSIRVNESNLTGLRELGRKINTERCLQKEIWKPIGITGSRGLSTCAHRFNAVL